VSESTVDTNGLSYYAVYAKKSTGGFGAGVPDGKYLIDKIYSLGDPRGIYVPASAGTYQFRVYAVNSLGQYSLTGKDVTLPAQPTATELGLGAVNPIQDVTIKSLRLTDDTEPNAPGVAHYDEFDGSDIRVEWETSVPEVQGTFRLEPSIDDLRNAP
jgi:hypothetical protein